MMISKSIWKKSLKSWDVDYNKHLELKQVYMTAGR